jgi:hypothetical protein
MSIQLLCFLCLIQRADKPWHPVLQRAGYEPLGAYSMRGSNHPQTGIFEPIFFESFRHPARTKLIAISVEFPPAGTTVEERWGSFARGFARAYREHVPPSGYPLAERLYFWADNPGQAHVRMYARQADVRMHTKETWTIRDEIDALAEDGKRKPHLPWPKGEQERVWENVARWVLAEWSSRAMTGQTQTVGGHTIPGLTTHENLRLGNVRQLALKKGLSYRLNEETGFATVSSGTRTIVLPLGSPKIKVGNEMRDLGQIVVAVNKEPYVPIAELARW